MFAFILKIFRLLFFIQIPKKYSYIFNMVLSAMCGFNYDYHDLNICYYGRPIMNIKKCK